MLAWLKRLFAQPVYDHAFGWIVLYDERPVLELTYFGPDDPWNVFTFDILERSCPLDHLVRSALRSPDDRVVFKNRRTGEIVSDEMFWTGWHDQNDPNGRPLVSIRDFRGLV